jgi:hypothetical protein
MAFQFMACRGLRSSLFIFFVIFGGASVFLFSWFSGRAFGQESDSKTTHSSVRERDGDRPYLRDRLDWNWNQRDRSLLRGESAAGLRFRAYNQKMAMRAERAARMRVLHPQMRCPLHTLPSRAWVGHPLLPRVLLCGPRWGRLRSLPTLREMERKIITGSRGAPLRY